MSKDPRIILERRKDRTIKLMVTYTIKQLRQKQSSDKSSCSKKEIRKGLLESAHLAVACRHVCV
jgi:hypothetical protein